MFDAFKTLEFNKESSDDSSEDDSVDEDKDKKEFNFARTRNTDEDDSRVIKMDYNLLTKLSYFEIKPPGIKNPNYWRILI